MATTLEYGGIPLSDITTLTFEQKPVYTDDMTTYLYDEFTIKVHAMFAPGLEPSNPGESPGHTYATLVGCLSKPQQQLVFKDGVDTLIFSPQKGFKVDAKNGPTPVSLNVKQLNPGAYSVEYEIKTFQYNCCTNILAPTPADQRVDMTTPFIAIRWSENVSIDEKFASKIVRKGRMWFRADVLDSLGKRADDYRSTIVGTCPLRPRFLRTSEYTVQEDGLVLDFQITDKETYAVPLDNLVRWDGEYRAVTVKGTQFKEEIHVRVQGDYNTSKFLLFQSAFKIASSRMFISPPDKLITGGYFMDKLNDNVVELHLQVTSAVNSRTFYGMQFSRAPLVNLLDPNSLNSNTEDEVPDPGVRGTADTLYLACNVLQDPCLAKVIQPVPGGGASEKEPTDVDRSITPAAINVVPRITTSGASYSDQTLSASNYVDTVMDISYGQDTHTLHMPVASSSGSAASFAVVANPTMTKTVNYSLEAIGNPPELPSTVSTDPNEVLLAFEVVPGSVSVEADGVSRNWRVTGRYLYGIKDPTTVRILAGRPPWLALDYSQTEIPMSNFVAGLTSPGTQTSTLVGVVSVS